MNEKKQMKLSSVLAALCVVCTVAFVLTTTYAPDFQTLDPPGRVALLLAILFELSIGSGTGQYAMETLLREGRES